MNAIRFIEPLDVLFLRGNRLFGDAGSYGESLVPPWPSLAAGALRAAHFAVTGTALDDPEDFRLTAFHLGRRVAGGIEAIHAVPADLVLAAGEGERRVTRLGPAELAHGILSSAPLSMVPVLAQNNRSKPASGYWLAARGWQKYLEGKTPDAADFVQSGELWTRELRVGVGLQAATRSAEDHKLFSMQAIAFKPGVGFVTASAGRCAPAERGTLRFGGDGRGAAMSTADVASAQIDLARIAAARRARIVLATPGVFPDGWRLPGMREDGHFELAGIRARIVAAAVPRAEVVSGWDMRTRSPKNAERVVPTGSVYWLDDIEATAEALGKLAEHGLWPENDQHTARRIEGFNRFAFAAY